MTAQSRLIKSIEEKIKFAPNDGGAEIPQHVETAKQILRDVLTYVSDDILYEAASRDAVHRAIEEIGE